MAEKDTKKVIRELQQRINRYIRLTLKDIKTEAKEEFDRNFQREAFFTEKWKEDDTLRMRPGEYCSSPERSAKAYGPRSWKATRG